MLKHFGNLQGNFRVNQNKNLGKFRLNFIETESKSLKKKFEKFAKT